MIFTSVDGTNLDTIDDLYTLFRKVGYSLDSKVSNMSTESLDYILDDIAECEALLQYLRERVDQELTQENDDEFA